MTLAELEEAAHLLGQEFDDDVAQAVLLRLLAIHYPIRNLARYVRHAGRMERLYQKRKYRLELLLFEQAIERIEKGTSLDLMTPACQEALVTLSEVPPDILAAELTPARLTSTQKTRRNRWRRRVENEPMP